MSATAQPASPAGNAMVRHISLTSATALVVSNMVGVGIFGFTGFLAGDLGSPSLVFGIWVVGAICALLGAVCYSELAINFPKSGGEYVYLTESYGPSWGFMTGWVSLFAGFSGTIAGVCLTLSDYLGYFFPALRVENTQFVIGSGVWQLKFGGAQLLGAAIVAVFTWLNVVGVEKSAKAQNILTALKLAVMLAFIGLAFTIGQGSTANFTQSATRTSSNPIGAQFAISLFWIYLAYSGWNAATYVAAEVRSPERTLPRALAIGTLLVMVLYLFLNAVFVYAAPLEELKGVIAVGSLAASKLFGPGIASAFSALMAVSLLATINAMVTVGPRVYYAMAQDGAFLPGAARLHPKYRTPAFAILAQGLVTIAMMLTPFPDLVSYVGFLLSTFAAMAVASLFWFRRRPGWKKLGVVSFAYPLAPALFVGVSIWMTIYGILLRPTISLAAAATVAVGALIFHWTLRPRSTPPSPAEGSTHALAD